MSPRSLDLQNEEKRIQAENVDLNRTEEERQAEEAPENAKKLYSQAEVNEIIRERLRRERAKASPTPEEAKEAELSTRELRLQQKAMLYDRDLPADDVIQFLDSVDIASMEGFENTIDNLLELLSIIGNYYERRMQERATGLDAGMPHVATAEHSILKKIFNMGGHF